MSELHILTGHEPSSMDCDIASWAEWLGISAVWHQALPAGRGVRSVVAVSADTLLKPRGAEAVRQLLSTRGNSVFVYGITDSSEHKQITALCDARVRLGRVPASAELEFAFPANARPWVGPLAGQNFVETPPATRSPCFGLIGGDCDGRTLLAVGELAHFYLIEPSHGTTLFLWCATSTVSPSERVPRGTGPDSYYSRLLPPLIFLKAAFGPQCWHNYRHKARLIVDDCLLRPRFGFIDYDQLVRSMRRVRYATTVAYIPWNYRRARPATVHLFSRERDRLGLCVHGCDHTGGEFASRDESNLAWRSDRALSRMDHFERTTGLAVDRVMVFPQGKFSPEAMRCLRGAGYLAAINTEAHPSPPDASAAASLGELMLPASNRFSGFALLPRQYPKRTVDFAVDLFLGRAALVVEHHEFVRSGYARWESFVSVLNSLVPNLEWCGLEDIARDCCLERSCGDGNVDVRMFCGTAIWRNDTDQPVHTRWTKHEPQREFISAVCINGEPVAFDWHDGIASFETNVSPRSSVTVQVRDRAEVAVLPRRTPGVIYEAGVLVRRCLSELVMAWQTRSSQRSAAQG